MGKLSAAKNILGIVGSVFETVWTVIKNGYNLVWGFLKIRVPFVKALVRRHTNNPSTIFVDIALFIIFLYVTFGVVGYVLIYSKSSESRFSEALATLYPLPAAKVNGSYVWGHKFLERLRFLNTFNARAPQGTTKPPTHEELRQRVLEGLIEDQVIVLEAKKRGLRVTEDELKKSLEKQGQPNEVAQKIKELYGMSLADFRGIIAEQILKEKVKNAVLARIRIRHILVSTQPVANVARAQLAGGKDFAEVAKEFSQDAKTKDTGGDLGYWRKSELAAQISPAFEDAAFALQVNEISGAVQSAFGYHILQVTERSGDNLQTYEEWYKQAAAQYPTKRYIRT